MSDRPALEERPIDTSAPFASLVLPGLGQFLQRRPLIGLAHLSTVTAYLILAGTALGGGRAYLVAVFWSLWSVGDAWWWSRRQSA